MSYSKDPTELPLNEPIKASPRVELDLIQAGQLHDQLVRCYRQGADATNQAYIAYQHALESRIKAWCALATVERHLFDLEERLGLKNSTYYLTREYLTIEKERPETHVMPEKDEHEEGGHCA